MLYDYDPETKKVKGLIGIDNDCSFLKNDLKSPLSPLVRLPGINCLKVIDEEMAERVSKLTEGELKNTLHGFGLDQKAIDKAWERTRQLQDAIRIAHKYDENGRLRLSDNNEKIRINIVGKDSWSKLSLEKLGGGGYKNYFRMIKESAFWIDKKEPVFPKYKRCNPSQKSLLLKAMTSTLYKQAKDASPWFFASNRYKNILTKLKEYNDEPIEVEQGLIKLDQAKFTKLDELKNAINTYKSEKIRDGFIDKDWNLTRAVTGKDLDRINLVKGMENYVKSVEDAKANALAAKEKLEARRAYADKANKFIGKGRDIKEGLVAIKLEEEKANQPLVQEEINASDNITNDIVNDKGEEIYSFLKKEDLFEPEEKEVQVHSENDIEKEVEKENLTKSI